MVRVKICGITNHRDARMSVEMGADAIGFIFAPSPRQITPEKAREIICSIPPFVHTVGVFVNERSATVRRIMEFCHLDLIQFHGDESPEVCGDFMPHTIKAFRVKDRSVLQTIKPYFGKIRALLFDTYVRETIGGTGKTFDWSTAVMGKVLGVPIILSGGLGPSNIAGAISKVNPFALDINSGIEERPGKKDHILMEKLMENIRNAENGKGSK